MFYDRPDGHGLPHDPFKAIVTPRPIGWISTLGPGGVANLAPYSFFNAVSARPNMVGFAGGALRHSIRNARDTGEFAFNLTSMELAERMNLSSTNLPDDESEFDFAGVEMAPARHIAAPIVAASPAVLECRVVHFLELTDLQDRATDHYLVIGEVVGTHIRDEFIRDGRFDNAAARVVARCGYHDYTVVDSLFEMPPPKRRA